MSRTSKVAVVANRPRVRRRKPSGKARFAAIRLDDSVVGARPTSVPMTTAFELVFPDGLTLRVAHDADPVTLEQFFRRFRRRMD
jgi:hypothetical protein